MHNRLRDLIETEIIKAAPDQSYKLVKAEEFDSFGDATGIVEAGNVRVRIVRDRGQLFADFASAHSPELNFDSAAVFELLGLSSDAGFHGDDTRYELSAIRKFLTVFRSDLDRIFGAHQFRETNERLEAIRQDQSQRRLG